MDSKKIVDAALIPTLAIILLGIIRTTNGNILFSAGVIILKPTYDTIFAAITFLIVAYVGYIAVNKFKLSLIVATLTGALSYIIAIIIGIIPSMILSAIFFSLDSSRSSSVTVLLDLVIKNIELVPLNLSFIRPTPTSIGTLLLFGAVPAAIGGSVAKKKLFGKAADGLYPDNAFCWEVFSGILIGLLSLIAWFFSVGSGQGRQGLDIIVKLGDPFKGSLGSLVFFLALAVEWILPAIPFYLKFGGSRWKGFLVGQLIILLLLGVPTILLQGVIYA